MASSSIMYWYHIPTQIKVSDEDHVVKKPLPDRFMAAVDQAAMQAGLAGTDDYLNGWHWGVPKERPGPAEDVAEALVQEIIRQYRGKPIPLEVGFRT